MIPEIFYYPSFYAHVFNGLLLLGAIIIMLKHYQQIQSKPFNIIILLLLFSIAMGVHGLSHADLEKRLNFNPLISMT